MDLYRLVEGSSMLLNAHFMSWPKEFLLFSVNLPVALSGGYITYRSNIHHECIHFLFEIPPQPRIGSHLLKITFIYSHLSMGIAAFITEISTPEQRTFRLAMIHFVSSLGSPIGTKVNVPFSTKNINFLDNILNL